MARKIKTCDLHQGALMSACFLLFLARRIKAN